MPVRRMALVVNTRMTDWHEGMALLQAFSVTSLADVRREAALEGDDHQASGSVAGGDQGLRLVGRHDHRLLEEDVETGFETGSRLAEVLDVRRDDEGCVEAAGEPLEEPPPVRLVRRHREAASAELRGSGVVRGGRRLADGGDLRVASVENDVEMVPGHRAHPDESESGANRVALHYCEHRQPACPINPLRGTRANGRSDGQE